MTRTEELRRMGAPARTRLNHAENSARELLSASLGIDPWERIENMRKAGERKARAIGVAYQLEEEKKVVLAQIANEMARVHASESISEAKLDRLARASETYRQHIKVTAQAIEEREEAESEYWALRSEMEWDKSAIAHTNAMSRLEEPS